MVKFDQYDCLYIEDVDSSSLLLYFHLQSTYVAKKTELQTTKQIDHNSIQFSIGVLNQAS